MLVYLMPVYLMYLIPVDLMHLMPVYLVYLMLVHPREYLMLVTLMLVHLKEYLMLVYLMLVYLMPMHLIPVNLILVYLRDMSHASVSQGRPSNMLMYLRDGSAQTSLPGATLRKKLQIKLSTSPSHSTLTPGRPVPALTL